MSGKPKSHGNVRGIILLPHFRPSPAPLPCEKKILRWPGPFGSGFLSPQPPGAVGIGPVRRGVKSQHTGPTKVGPFCFWGPARLRAIKTRKASALPSQQISGCTLAGARSRTATCARPPRRDWQKPAPRSVRAFSSEVDTGSREENASNKNLELRF